MTFKLEKSGGFIKLSGNIDESIDLASSLDLYGTLFFDVGEVTGINSIGTLKMIRLIERKAGLSIQFYKCSSVFKFLISYVALKFGSIKASKIFSSLLLDYNCPQCGEEKQVLVETRRLGNIPAQFSLPQEGCPTCQFIMQTTEDAEELIESFSQGE